MMIFIDTGAFLARYLAADCQHKAATSIWNKICGNPLFTSNHVLDETFTLLARRAGYRFAAERAFNVYNAGALEILYGTKEDEMDALGLFRKYSDQKVSFTDCVSFVLMKRHHIRRAFSFDRHFIDAGFEVIGLSGQ